MQGYVKIINMSGILVLILSGSIVSSTLVGTSYASQVQVQPPATQSQTSPPPPTPICNPNSPQLQLGSTGAKVIELQRALTQAGYGSLLGQGGIDGRFETLTQNAVKKFQQDNRLPVDGKVGPVTWGALCGLFLILLLFN